MSIADELRKLQELHKAGSLTNEEFATAKANVLSGNPSPDPVLKEHLEEIKEQNELAALDRSWTAERERYMMSGRYGNRYVPNKGSSLILGFVVTLGGMVWTTMAAQMGAPKFFLAFGVLFILAGVCLSAYSYKKALDYDKAYARYQRRRADLTRSFEEP